MNSQARSVRRDTPGRVQPPRAALVILATILLFAVPLLAVAEEPGRSVSKPEAPSVAVVVRAAAGARNAAAESVMQLGGSVGHQLPIIDGFAATIPKGTVA